MAPGDGSDDGDGDDDGVVVVVMIMVVMMVVVVMRTVFAELRGTYQKIRSRTIQF